MVQNIAQILVLGALLALCSMYPVTAAPSVLPGEYAAYAILTGHCGDDSAVLAGVGGGGAIIRSIDSGTSFKHYSEGIPVGIVASLAQSNNGTLAGTWGDGVYERDCGSSTWERIPSEGMESGFQNIYSLAVSQSGDVFAADPNRHLYWLAPQRDTWRRMPVPELPGGQLLSIFVDPSENVLWAGMTNSRGIYRFIPAAHGRFDSGHWEQIGDVSSSFEVHAIQRGPDGQIWLGTTRGVYRWGGSNWQRVTGSPDVITAMLAHPVLPQSELFAGTLTGEVWKYDAATATWAKLELGIPNVRVRDLGVMITGRLIAATQGGIYHLDGAALMPTPTPTPTSVSMWLPLTQREHLVPTPIPIPTIPTLTTE